MKSIFRGMRRGEAERLLVLTSKLNPFSLRGSGLTLWLLPLDKGHHEDWVDGQLEWMVVLPHGTILILKRRGGTGVFWDLVPVWLSRDGNSGVPYPWKHDNDLKKAMVDYRAFVLREKREKEGAVSRAMAL